MSYYVEVRYLLHGMKLSKFWDVLSNNDCADLDIQLKKDTNVNRWLI